MCSKILFHNFSSLKSVLKITLWQLLILYLCIMYLLNDVKFLRYINVDANTWYNIFKTMRRFRGGDRRSVWTWTNQSWIYLHSKITENMPRTLWQTQLFRRNPLPSLQKDSESTHDNSFKYFFQLHNILQFLFLVIVQYFTWISLWNSL